MVQACILATQMAEAGGSKVQGPAGAIQKVDG